MDKPNNENFLENSDLKKWERLKGVGGKSGSQKRWLLLR